MKIQQLSPEISRTLGLSKSDASRMHVCKKLKGQLPITKYKIEAGNKIEQYMVGDTFVKIDTYEKRLNGKNVLVGQKLFTNV